MQYIQNLKLDVSTEGKYQYIYAKQGDNESRSLRITLVGNGKQIIPEAGTTVALRVLKPDGKSCVDAGTVNSDGTIMVELKEQALACPGVTKADVSLVKGDSVLSSATFLIQNEEIPASANNTPSENEYFILDAKIDEATQAAANANAAAASVDQKVANAVAPIAAEFLAMEKSLGEDHAVYQNLTDSNAMGLLDGNGNQIEGRVLFADAGDVADIRKTVAALETCLWEMISLALNTRVAQLEKGADEAYKSISELREHAILDNTFI